MSIPSARSAHTLAQNATFLSPVEQELKLVDEILEHELVSSVRTISLLTRHIIRAGGKRLRPSLVLLSAKACASEVDMEKLLRMAAVTEMVHMATLIHDDVIDAADSRRGRPTANSRWGNQISVLAGDYVVAKAFAILSEFVDSRTMKVLSHATMAMTEGEISQIESKGDTEAQTAYYLSIIRDKTAAFTSGCCEVGAILAGAGEVAEECLAQYGLDLGMAFQITDDILDLVGEPSVTGKPVGGDIREGKITLPLILALQHCTQSERELIEEIVHNSDASDEEIDQIRQIAQRTGAVEGARESAREFVEQAVDDLMPLPDTEAKNSLIELAQYVLHREK